MSNEDKHYEQVGNIRIKEPKKKKKKKKTSDTPLGVKIFVWIMVIAMIGSFFAPIIYYLYSVISSS